MNRFRSITTVACAAAVSLGVLLSACGDDSSDDSSGTPVQPIQSAPSKTPSKKAPDSAGDKRPSAPDDAISKKPGGSGSSNGGQSSGQSSGQSGGQKAKPKKKSTSGSKQQGGVSPESP